MTKKVSKKATVRAMTQSAVISELAESNEMHRADVKFFLETLSEMTIRELNLKKKSAPGKIVIPGICRIVAKKKPARKARKGINPFTKEACVFKAKPASTAVKIYPVKALKDAVAG